MRLLGVVAAICLVGHAAARNAAGRITAEMIADDTRLDKRVSLKTDRRYIAEICEEISKQTGVEIRADENDGAADAQAIVALREMRLADALNALHGLLSYQDHPYLWTRVGSPPDYRYVLSRSVKAENLARWVSERVEADFEAECAHHARLCRLSPEELEREAREDPRARNMLLYPRVRAAWRMLLDALAPGQLEAVLRGETAVVLKTSALPPSGQEFVRLVWSEGKRTLVAPDGSERDAPYPEEIVVTRLQFPEDAVPALGIAIQHAGGYTYSAERLRRQRVVSEYMPGWLLVGESESHRLEKQELRATEGDSPHLLGGLATDMVALVHTLSEGGRISVLCRVPWATPGSFATPRGRTLGDKLHALDADMQIQHKWLGDTLLLSYACWYRDEGVVVPWRVEKGIRSRLASATGFSFSDLCDLAASLQNAQQARFLVSRHPELACVTSGYLRVLGRLRLANQAMNPAGVALNDAIRAHLCADGVEVEPDAAALRVVEVRPRRAGSDGSTSTLHADTRATWWVEILRSTGGWHRVMGVGTRRASSTFGGLEKPQR